MNRTCALAGVRWFYGIYRRSRPPIIRCFIACAPTCAHRNLPTPSAKDIPTRCPNQRSSYFWQHLLDLIEIIGVLAFSTLRENQTEPQIRVFPVAVKRSDHITVFMWKLGVLGLSYDRQFGLGKCRFRQGSVFSKLRTAPDHLLRQQQVLCRP